MTGQKGALSVVIDGTPLPEGEARDLWQRFSAHMEAHQGDLAGFASGMGFTSAHPRSIDGKAVLVLSRTQPQEPYGKAASGPSPGGSPVRHAVTRDAGVPGGKRRKPSDRRR